MVGGTEYVTEVFYQSQGWTVSQDICGRMRLVSRFTAPESNSAAVNDSGRALQEALNNVRFAATVALFGEQGIKPISDRIIAAVDGRTESVQADDVQNELAALRGTLTAELRKTVLYQTKNSQHQVLTQYTDKGFLWAGSLFTDLSRIKDAVRTATKSDNDFTPGTYTLSMVSSGDVLNAQNNVFVPYMTLTGLVLSKAHLQGQGSSTTPTMPAFDSGFSMADFADGGSSIKGATSRFFKSWADGLVSGVVMHLSDKNNKSVLWQLKDLGDYIAGYTEAGMVAQAIAVGALDGLKTTAETASNQTLVGAPMSPLAGAIAGVKTLFEKLYSMISPSASVLLYLGYFLGIWLPAVPFLITTLAIVGWILSAIESVAALSLFAAAHTTPATNDSFIGSQAQGYLLIMSLFFRPALIVLGLIVSMAVLNPIVHWINPAFLLYFRSAQADSLTGLLTVAGVLLLYTGLIFAVTIMVFALPQTMPDRILRWVGAGIADLGESNATQRVEQGASSQAKGAALAAAAKSSRFRDKDNERKNRERENSFAARDRDHEPEGMSKQSAAITAGD